MKIITKRVVTVLIGGFLITVLLSLKQGSSIALLKCKSDSGRTEFYAELQDIKGFLEKAVLKIDSTQLEYFTDENNIVFDPKIGIFTMSIDDFKNRGDLPHKYLKFWAIPETFKIIDDKSYHQIYEFKAKIDGSEFRTGKEFFLPTITLNCRLEYKK